VLEQGKKRVCSEQKEIDGYGGIPLCYWEGRLLNRPLDAKRRLRLGEGEGGSEKREGVEIEPENYLHSLPTFGGRGVLSRLRGKKERKKWLRGNSSTKWMRRDIHPAPERKV